MSAKDRIDAAIRELQLALVDLKNEVPVDPGNDWVKLFEITVPKTNAWCVAKYNNAGRPVMKIYPESESKPSERVQYVQGYKVRVKHGIVKADGGEKFWEIADVVKKGGVVVYDKLYLRDDHGKLV